jgi:hypothetical protein
MAGRSSDLGPLRVAVWDRGNVRRSPGGVAERSNAPVLKTGVRHHRTAGSNPAPSAQPVPICPGLLDFLAPGPPTDRKRLSPLDAAVDRSGRRSFSRVFAAALVERRR